MTRRLNKYFSNLTSRDTGIRARGFAKHLFRGAARSRNKKGAGFTLIEVILVLAISSALAVLLIGLYGNQSRRARFADATEGVVSSLQSIKNEVNSGFSTGDGTNKDRIFFGKAVVFEPESNVYKVFTLTADNADILTNLSIENPNGDSVKIPWGVVFDQASGNLNTVVFTRSLGNAQLKTYIFNSGTAITEPSNYNLSPPAQTSLSFSEDPDDSSALVSTVTIESSSGYISSGYEN